tara:strand:+ start:348 stop:602 length:255 start_codon:yes stop_codon:yes gene_type:complete
MQKKRFIAGAICPQCRKRDKVFVYYEADEKWRACSSCDFNEPFDQSDNGQPEEIATRVNQSRLGEQPLAHEVAVEVVKLIDPKK